jgi:hypothetical protein
MAMRTYRTKDKLTVAISFLFNQKKGSVHPLPHQQPSAISHHFGSYQSSQKEAFCERTMRKEEYSYFEE